MRSRWVRRGGVYLAITSAFALTLGLLPGTAAAVVPRGPFVTFQKTAANPSIQAGDVASFTITAQNIGGAAANNVGINDVLPNSGLAWAENPDVPQCTVSDNAAGDVLACSVASLAVGASFSVTVEATTDPEVCDYVLTNTATLSLGRQVKKTATATIFVACRPPEEEGCTFTQGFWKNHTEAWPVSSLVLGSVSYTDAQLSAIFDEPVSGNGLISLAHQLIAAKLNIANGASATDVQDDIDAADALIDGLVVPPVGSGHLDPSTTSSLVDALTDFNEGTTGPGHCPE